MSMEIRRLEPADCDLLLEAYEWDADAPTWYRQATDVFGDQTGAEFVNLLSSPAHALIGIFTPELTGVIIMHLIAKGCLEAHLMAQRGADPTAIVLAASQVRDELFGQGAREVFVWVAERNRHVKEICRRIGFVPTGFEMLKGSYRNRVIIWQHMSIIDWPNMMRNAA